MYVELHARSAFSFLEGSSLPEDLAGICARLNMPAMALLDTDGVYGAPRFHLAAKKLGIKAHIGAEVTAFLPRSGEFRLPLLVSSRAGYQNLCRMITKMKLRAKKGEGSVRQEELEEHAGGLICLTGGADGPLAAALQHGGIEEARKQVEQLIGMFGRKNVFVELQRHFHREEETRNRAAIAIARSLNLPLLATNGVCYAAAKDRELCDAFTAIRRHRTLSTAGRLLARNSERHLKSLPDMRKLFADLPEAVTNTHELSSRLEFTLNDLGYQFPRYPVPEGATMNSFLRERAGAGFRQRYGRATNDMQTRAQRQIERELALIEKLNLAGYFLIVWDLVRFCREQNILVQGRGSAANSAVCYSLGITAVDPVSMELLFERFLSEERGEWPDIERLPRFPPRSLPGNSATKMTPSTAASAMPDSTSTIPACANITNSAWPCRTCRAISASTPAAWSSVRDNSILWFRSNPHPWPAAWWCSGTKKIAPTWASSKLTCSALE